MNFNFHVTIDSNLHQIWKIQGIRYTNEHAKMKMVNLKLQVQDK